jgi:hypothetical protein
VTIVERKLEDIEKTLSDEDAISRMKSILPLLDVFKTGRHGVAQCILTHVYDAVLKQSVEGLDGVILDKDLLETVSNAVKGIDAETVTAFATAKLSKSNSTDIMSIAKDVSKTINIEDS